MKIFWLTWIHGSMDHPVNNQLDFIKGYNKSQKINTETIVPDWAIIDIEFQML